MIRRLLLLNGVAIVGVILFHSAGWGIVAMFDWAYRYNAVPADQVGTVSYYFLRFIEQLVVFSIPAFLFVSGFFIAFATGRKHKTISWHVVGIRIRDLLIPYTIWTLIVWFLSALENGPSSPLAYFQEFILGEANPAYYYVPLLTQFLLLSPFLVRWAKANFVSMLVITGLIQLAVILQYYPSLFGYQIEYLNRVPKWLFVSRIFWFSLGIIVGFNIKPFQDFLFRYKKLFLGLAIILVPVGMIEWEIIQSMADRGILEHRETILDAVYSLAVIFAFLGYYKAKIPFANTLDDLGSKSFGIYLVHSPAMTYAARAIAVLTPIILSFTALFFIIMVVVSLGVPLVLMAIMGRSFLRPYYKYVFG